MYAKVPASVMGPIGCPAPYCMERSTSFTLASPRSTIKMALGKIGEVRVFEENKKKRGGGGGGGGGLMPGSSSGAMEGAKWGPSKASRNPRFVV